MTTQALHLHPRALHRWHSCGRKVRHQTVAEAARAARVMWQRKRVTLAVYHCRHCDGYHIGKRRTS